MKIISCLRNVTFIVAATAAAGAFSGCANYEVNTKRGNIPGHYIRYEMQEADRAVESARQAGKEKLCPAEFKAAEDAKIKAYDVFRACFTEEGAALAKKATAMANALCPARLVPPPEPAPSPKASIPAPTDNLSIEPRTVLAGQSATLEWTSENATSCDIQPEIGKVKPQGKMTITPDKSASYTLVCSGEGGSAKSAANIVVTLPAPVMAALQPKAAPARQCTQFVLNIQFDTSKYDIKPKYRGELKKLADFLKEFPETKGVIEGHTDSVGSLASNMKLSQHRADSVRNYLIKNYGIAPERLSAKGFGPTKPVADNKTKEGKQKNRRIEANFECETN